MTSSLTCVSGNPANSATTTMIVNPVLPVSVVASPDLNNVCEGTSVTFTATPTNGGTPSYQWYLNGAPTGLDQDTYSFIPANGDQVYVEMTSDLTCISGSPATSTTTTMIVNPVLPVSVLLQPDQNNVCAGTSVTFTATPTNGGTPTYQWYRNAIAVGTNQNTYTFTPANNDQVYVRMTSSLGCVSGNPANSTTTTMIVNPVLPVSVVASPDLNNVCAGTSVTFTATPTNGGTPSYQWYLNGAPIGLDQNTYSFIPANGDQVYVEMTSDLTCVSGSPATSTTTTMVVNASLPAGVASSPDQNNICDRNQRNFHRYTNQWRNTFIPVVSEWCSNRFGSGYLFIYPGKR